MPRRLMDDLEGEVLGKVLAELHTALARSVGIEVRINVCRGAHFAVPEPHLKDFHIDIFGDQERRAGVAQIGKAELA